MKYDYYCPACGKKLALKEKSLFCENGHCYDLAKSGYVNLLLANMKNSVDPGDNIDMIRAREEVMAGGYYKALADGICELLRPYGKDVIIDVGCGIGYVPHVVKTEYPDSTVLGTDISKNAINSAAKHYKDVAFAVASSVRLPLPDHSVDAVICAFAPVFREEFLRLLKPDGVFIRVIPDINHLMALKSALYATPRPNELDPLPLDGFDLVSVTEVKSVFHAQGSVIGSVVKMTPYYYHTAPSDFERLCQKEKLDINTEFNVRLYKVKN